MRIHQIISVVRYNFKQWNKSPRIITAFLLAFILCFLLSDKAVTLAVSYDSTMQIVEAFIWTFGDSNSILLSSMLLLLLFMDMPFISSGTPFYLVRTNRKTWILGQILYIFLVTFIYLVFILFSTSLICMNQSFIGNMWSETAALLGYSGLGKEVALPALVTTLEMTTPYPCMFTIFILMFLYALLMAMIMLYFNLRKGQMAGVLSVFVFSIYGFLLNPETIKTICKIPDVLGYKANVLIGWFSPLNHATYHMHSFGYDKLPTMWQTYIVFIVLIALFIALTIHAIKKYNFNFTGTEG